MTRRPSTRPRLFTLLVALGPALVVLGSAACGPKDRAGLPEAVPGSSSAIPVATPRDAEASDATVDGVAPQPDAASDAPADTARDADADAGTCLPGGTLAMDAAFGGSLAVRGTVTLPAPLPSGRTFVLSIGLQSGDTRTQTFFTATATDRFTFRIAGLAAGLYVVRAQVDVGGNGSVSDPGDYDGYYDGTAVGPIQVRADAKPVFLVGACLDNVNFGPGVKL
ncbi:MAG TPA: hypothetical protein PK141_18580 [Polyangiaceae bacterium]|nr:hypothetical protein [Polyangiaceae bacterium]